MDEASQKKPTSTNISCDESNNFIELDKLFLNILYDICQMVIQNANHSAEYILKLSGNFLNQSVHNALKEFHQLYFSANKFLKQTSKEINDDVDDMIKSIQSLLDDGKIVDSDAIKEGNSTTNRLSLAGLQKKLEKIITLDENIKDMLIPVLSSMQFEDILQHRLKNMIKAWEITLNHNDPQHIEMNTEIIAESIAGLLTSHAERKLYYSLVLKSEPPDGIDEAVGFLDALIDTQKPKT